MFFFLGDIQMDDDDEEQNWVCKRIAVAGSILITDGYVFSYTWLAHYKLHTFRKTDEELNF